MNILVTGAGGLVGSYLLPLIEKEHTIYTISNTVNSSNNLKIDFSNDCDTEKLPKIIEAIVHLAQSEDFRDFPSKAKEVFYVNTLSTLKLIDFAYRNNIKKFIFASSGGLYGNSNEPFNENSEIVYSEKLGYYVASKLCSEVILDNYNSLLTVVQLRFFFVYGKGQKKGMLISRLIDNILNKKPIILQDNNGIKINPIYAKDAAEAIKQSLQINQSSKYNIGGEEVLTIREISEIIGNVLGIKPEYSIQNTSPDHIYSNITKMKNELIHPQYNFKNGIKEILK